MSDQNKETMEKAAAINEYLFQNYYLPAFVEQYNEKAASAGLDLLHTEEDIANALNLVNYIEANGATSQPQPGTLAKAAAAVTVDQPSERAIQYASAAAQDKGLLDAIRALTK